MDEPASHLRYWGKADNKGDAGPTWHPFAYHSLDVAAVAAALWEQSPTIRRAFASAFAVADSDLARLRAWVLFFVALHDIGKLHALFQVFAPEAAALAWPGLNPAEVKRFGSDSRYDHGHEGFRLVKSELPTWTSTEDRAARQTWRRWRPWIAAATGHHGDIPGELEEGPPPRAYAQAPIREQDVSARQSWVQLAADLFLAGEGLGLADAPPDCETPARSLLAGFCSLCDWIGSNAEFFDYTAPGTAEDAYLAGRIRQIADRDILGQLGLLAPLHPYAGLSALLRGDEQPRGVQVLVDSLPLAAGLTICEAPTGSGKTEAALAHAWRLLGAGVADSIVFALPTQATANAMLTRAEAFAECAFGRANLVRDGTDRNRSLGNARRRFRLLGRVRTGAVGVEFRVENRSRHQRVSRRHAGRWSLKPGGSCLLAPRGGAAHGNGAAG